MGHNKILLPFKRADGADNYPNVDFNHWLMYSGVEEEMDSGGIPNMWFWRGEAFFLSTFLIWINLCPFLPLYISWRKGWRLMIHATHFPGMPFFRRHLLLQKIFSSKKLSPPKNLLLQNTFSPKKPSPPSQFKLHIEQTPWIAFFHLESKS